MKNAVSKKRTPKPPSKTTLPAVRFEFQDVAAQSVCVAGSFNDWNPGAAPMVAAASGQWVKEVALPPGVYEYLFVVDGEWRVDPRGARQVPNAFGGVNSVLEISPCG